MKTKSALAAAIIVLVALPAMSESFSIDWVTVQSSGSSAGGTFSVAGTVGQAEAGAHTAAGSFTIGGGFWSLLSGDPPVTSSNLVNGNFEAGFAGFTSDYHLFLAAGHTDAGGFAVGTNPSAYDPALASFGDHTTGSGNMLIVDGSIQPNGQIVWQETVSALPDHYYAFTAWAAAASDPNRPVLHFSANGGPLGTDLQLSSPVGLWQSFRAVWYSGTNTSALLKIQDLNTSGIGNNFALDDLSWDLMQNPSLPADGTVLYCRVNPTNSSSSIWLAALDGSSDTLITSGYRAHISLDRRYLVFTRDGPNGPAYGGRGFIWVRDLAAATETQIFSHSDYLIGADFVRDTSRIIFDYGCGDFSINRDGTGFNILSTGISGCYDDAPVVNPVDGRVVLHAASSGGGIIVGDANCQNKSYVPNSDLGVYPHWSWDGQWISYGKQLNYYEYAGHNLFKIRPDGTGKKQLTFFNDSTNAFPEGAAWSPDGSALIAAGTINGVNGLYQVATDGSGTIKPLSIARAGDRITYVGAVLGNVAPQLQLMLFQKFGNDLLLTHTALAGHTYALQSSSDLVTGSWTVVPGTTSLGAGSNVQITLKNAFTGVRRFYRVQQTQ